MKDKSVDSNTNESISKVSLTPEVSFILEKDSFIDLSEASLSLEGATIGISLDGESSTEIKLGANQSL